MKYHFTAKTHMESFGPRITSFTTRTRSKLLFNHKTPFQTTSKSCLFNLAYKGILVDFGPSFTMKDSHQIFDQNITFNYNINMRTWLGSTNRPDLCLAFIITPSMMTQLSDLLISHVNIRLDDHINRYCQMVLSPPFDPFGLYAQRYLFNQKHRF